MRLRRCRSSFLGELWVRGKKVARAARVVPVRMAVVKDMAAAGVVTAEVAAVVVAVMAEGAVGAATAEAVAANPTVGIADVGVVAEEAARVASAAATNRSVVPIVTSNPSAKTASRCRSKKAAAFLSCTPTAMGFSAAIKIIISANEPILSFPER